MPLRKRTVIIGKIVAAIAIPILVYAASPLFLSKTVNEPVPNGSGDNQFEKFMAMSEEKRFAEGQKMNETQKEVMMRIAAEGQDVSSYEAMTESMASPQSVDLSRTFVGVNDGIHNAEGDVNVTLRQAVIIR